jgi:hypothetical protein
MPEEEKEVQDVIEESSTTEDVETESSTEEQSEATEEQAVPEEQQIPYDRFKEVADEKNYWRDKYAEATTRPQEAPSQEKDPLEGMDPQTKVFYQDLDKRTQVAINRARKEERVQYQAELDALRMSTAKVQERLFRQDQKDVAAGSKEEIEIAQFIRMGMDPDRAAWAVMGPKRVESAKSGKVIKQQNKTKMKAQANVETSGVQENSGLPSVEGLDFRDELDKRMKEQGL